MPNVEDTVRESMALHMAYAHQCVTEASVRFFEVFRRFNYTTPKSYLELISLYKQLLDVSGGCVCARWLKDWEGGAAGPALCA